MVRRIVVAAFALGLFASIAAPKSASACAPICRANHHPVCTCVH